MIPKWVIPPSIGEEPTDVLAPFFIHFWFGIKMFAVALRSCCGNDGGRSSMKGDTGPIRLLLVLTGYAVELVFAMLDGIAENFVAVCNASA
jgi:hypothetical protein